tara:strand:+ start:105 stop:1088 length:984 start_codon:yes stop_codon:yes gene_type:complete
MDKQQVQDLTTPTLTAADKDFLAAVNEAHEEHARSCASSFGRKQEAIRLANEQLGVIVPSPGEKKWALVCSKSPEVAFPPSTLKKIVRLREAKQGYFLQIKYSPPNVARLCEKLYVVSCEITCVYLNLIPGMKVTAEEIIADRSSFGARLALVARDPGQVDPSLPYHIELARSVYKEADELAKRQRADVAAELKRLQRAELTRKHSRAMNTSVKEAMRATSKSMAAVMKQAASAAAQKSKPNSKPQTSAKSQPQRSGGKSTSGGGRQPHGQSPAKGRKLNRGHDVKNGGSSGIGGGNHSGKPWGSQQRGGKPPHSHGAGGKKKGGAP